MSYTPPDGWMIDWDLVYDGVNDFETVWYVYQWQIWTEKKLFRKPVERSGWKKVSGHRHEADAKAWLEATIKALETGRKK